MFESWLNHTPLLLIGLMLLFAIAAAAMTGHWLRKRWVRQDADNDDKEGYVVSAVMGLLALLLGFTFSLAVDRYETRRALVLQEANAIGTSYLRSQLLDEPHRSRMAGLLKSYTENRIKIARATPDALGPLVVRNDQLLTDLWSATAAAFDSVRDIHFSTSLLETVNEVIDLDSSRKTARNAHVPGEVFFVLFIYVVVTAGLLGHVLNGKRNTLALGFLFGLELTTLLLILDIDRPTLGGVRANQTPMIELLKTIKQQPVGTFDRWRGEPTSPDGSR